MFPDLDLSQIQIKLTTLMTPKDMETDEELVVTDGLGGVADDPLNPHNNPPASSLKSFLYFLFFFLLAFWL